MTKSLMFGIVIGGAVVATIIRNENKRVYAEVKKPEAEDSSEKEEVKEETLKEKVKEKVTKGWNKFCYFAIRHQTEITIIGSTLSIISALFDVMTKALKLTTAAKEANLYA